MGGMGPESTAELFESIIKATPVRSEQEHLRIIINNNPQIPDRTRAILGRGESPLGELTKTALNLERVGAEISLVLSGQDISVPLIDPLQILAVAVFREAKSKK